MKHVTKPGVYWGPFSPIGEDAVRVIVQVSGESPLLQIDWAIHVGAKQPITYEPNRLDLNFGKRLKFAKAADPAFPHALNVDKPGVYLATHCPELEHELTVVVQVSDESPMLQIDWAIVIGWRMPTVFRPLASELQFNRRLKVPELGRV